MALSTIEIGPNLRWGNSDGDIDDVPIWRDEHIMGAAAGPHAPHHATARRINNRDAVLAVQTNHYFPVMPQHAGGRAADLCVPQDLPRLRGNRDQRVCLLETDVHDPRVRAVVQMALAST